jgi:hypothetical protein
MFDHDDNSAARTSSADSVRSRLAEQLRERLTVAAEFATLGAYELLEREQVRAAHRTAERAGAAHQATPGASGGAHPATPPEPTQRVFLFARVPEAPCGHSAEAAPACTARIKAAVLAGGGQPKHHGSAARRARRHLARRGGAVDVPEQPCVWAAPGEAGAGGA